VGSYENMSSSIVIVLVVVLGLVVAAIMRARANSRLKPVLDAAARKHTAKVQHSFLGMPQLIKQVCGHTLRMTPMNISTASPEGGGQMTCVDFELPGLEAFEFRLREKPDARRNALPAALLGSKTSFALGIAHIDARFCLVAADAAKAARILTETSVAEAISRLPQGADIDVRGGKCYVSVKGLPQDIDFVDRLFDTSERLLASFRAFS